jgi:hypothetical protein
MASQWFVRGGGKVYGPLDDARLRRLVADGKINESTDIATTATGPWHPAARVRGLFQSSCAASPRPPRLPGASTASDLQSQFEASFSATQEPEGESTQGVTSAAPMRSAQNSSDAALPTPPSAAPTALVSGSTSHTCPTCKTPCALNARACPQCGYRFPNSAPFVIGGAILVLAIIGGIAATIVRQQNEEAEIWREVHRQNRERQETLQREISDGYRRLGDQIFGR